MMLSVAVTPTFIVFVLSRIGLLRREAHAEDWFKCSSFITCEGVSMSNCSQIFSDEALLQRVREMGQSMSELRNLRRRVGEAEARALARKRQRSFSPPQKALIAARVAANDRF